MSNAFDLVVRGRRVLTPEGLQEKVIGIRDGRIVEVLDPSDPRVNQFRSARESIDAGDDVVMPGIVDTHAHLNEPGRTEWEGYRTATQAAAAGGITTIVDMPLNCIPVTTSRAALETKKAAVADHAWVDYAFWGGLVPGNTHELEPLLDAGVAGVKAFLVHSGIDDFPHVSEADLRAAMPILAKRGAPLIVHAELEGHAPDLSKADPRLYSTYLASRPQKWETDAVSLVARLAAEYRCPSHIVHLSAAQALEPARAARRDGAPLTMETCPHYLALSAEEVVDGHTEFKCAPPVREKANQDALWNALKNREIELVVSDHSPCTPDLKKFEQGDFMNAWGGIASLQFTLPIVWTEAKKRGFSIEDVSRWMSFNTSKLAGLDDRKGRIAPGMDADLLIFQPDSRFTLTTEMIRHRHKVTPYLGRTLDGVVKATTLRGERVWDGSDIETTPRGRLLARRN